MSERTSTAVLDGPLKDTPELTANNSADQDQLDAFNREFGDADVDTAAIVADEAKLAQQKTKLEELAKFADKLDLPADRRRALTAIYGTEKVADMNDADISEFIATKGVIAAEVSTSSEEALPSAAPVEVEATAENLKTNTAPEGFPTREQIAEDIESEGSVKLGFWKKARLAMGAPGRAVWKGYSKLVEKGLQRSAKFNALSKDDQEKMTKRVGIISSLSALAIGGAMAAFKMDHMLGSNGGNHHDSTATGATEVSDPKEHHGGVSPVDQMAERQHQNEAQFIYSPEADPFNNPDRKEFNFRAALDTTTIDTAKADLTEGWKHNPLQFATAMGALGMIPNNQASIEGTAQQMLESPTLFASNHAAAMDVVNASSTRFVEGSYNAHGSYSMIENANGTQTLAYDGNVVDPQMMLVFDTPDGASAFGCDCGQPSEIASASAPAVEAPTVSTPAIQEHPQYYDYTDTATGNGNGTYEETPTYYTPPEEETYIPPVTPPITPPVTPPITPPVTPPVIPPTVVVPPEVKGNAYPTNEWVTPLDAGEFMPTPAPVETIVETLPSRDIGGGTTQAPIIDKITAPQGSETGGQMTEGTKPSLDTSPNTSGSSTVQKPESPSTNSSSVESSL